MYILPGYDDISIKVKYMRRIRYLPEENRFSIFKVSLS